MIIKYCVCNHTLIMHDSTTFVCAERYCKCLRFNLLHTRKTIDREHSNVAANAVIQRSGMTTLEKHKNILEY